jgi:subtilisin family serine protease
MNGLHFPEFASALYRHAERASLALLMAAGLTACEESITEPPVPATPQVTPQASVASVQPAGGRPVPDQYIVVLNDEVAAGNVAGLAQRLTAAHGATLRHTYNSVLKGFAVRLPAQAATALARDPHVAVVVQDEEGTFEQQGSSLSGTPQKTVQENAPWGLDRIDQRRSLSGTFWYPPMTFTNPVNVYIIDTGIDTSHPDFGGRATVAYDVTPGGDGRDCDGHGTAVASIAGGSYFGVAKGARLHAVKITRDTCSDGRTVIRGFASSELLAGIEWVLKNHVKPAVVNMSVGSSSAYHGSTPTFSGQLVNSAATKLAAAGVFVAAGAGNDNADACGVAPASALGVAAVAASDRTDAKWSSSNYGTCVDLYAPGVDVRSADLGYLRESTGSGTSLATPHVVGVAALYKATYGDAPSQQILDWMINTASRDVIQGNIAGTPNRLLHSVTIQLNDPRVFDAAFYLRQYPDLKAAYGTDHAAARHHWVSRGLPIEGRRGSREFDVQFYLRQHPNLQAYGTDYVLVVDHWLRSGLPVEGRRGSREFDVQFYLRQYPDLQAAFGTMYAAALDHWLRRGLPVEGRRGSREVDVQFYLGQYPDLQFLYSTGYVGALDHWIQRGLPVEGRRASADFDVQYYLATYEDLRAAYGANNYTAAFDHWVRVGMLEGRRGVPPVALR